ncbi:MAG: exodeoxyribonuclease V subunit gamma [Bacteroidaceae bacterium]|nr:exodeoxyribonuclease V subunit gamma [Bacteroidaceae bacterium]
MDSFLKQVATDLYKRKNGNLSHTAIVFPNKRAGLFFNEHLAAQSDNPVWAPAYISISELFRELSSYEIADSVKLVCELYKVFRQETQSKESLDDFYFWGELLISDFDDADKNLVNTDQLFTNLQDLRAMMNDYTFMDKDQEAAIQQFFHNFSIERRTALKERFISMWDVLGKIYRNFKETLQQQQLAYEGMLYRDVLENIDLNDLPYETYVFVGFNVLNKVEHELFMKLQQAEKALFYWDYDEFYMKKKHHEAGEFIKRNLKDFPSALADVEFNSLHQKKEIRYISSPTENAQARYLPQWIREYLTENERETAIVLCNEGLLQPVLHSLPSEVKHVNITMGFPLSQTPVYSYLNSLLEMQIQGYNPKTGRYSFQYVMAVLKHPYTRRLSQFADKLALDLTTDNRFYPLPSELCRDENLTLLFKPINGNLALTEYLATTLQLVAKLYQQETNEQKAEAFNQLYRESLFKAYTTVNRFHTLIEENELAVQPETFRRLLVKVLSTTNIPFHGEPAIGMQIMGILETRNLDFRHVVLLSTNEGQFPKKGNDASFIPYNLRKAFGMTTIEHKIAVYAYYFYRLLQRAEKVTLMYNNSSDGLNRGEWSRFMLQFLIEWPHDIIQQTLKAGQSPQGTTEICIPKNEQVMERIHRLFNLKYNKKAKFSPSALNCYLDCQLKFYLKYIANLDTPDEVSAEIDSATFGSIFHKTAEYIYTDLTARGSLITKEDIEKLLKDDVRLENYVDKAFKDQFFHLPDTEQPEYNGIQLINSAVILRYIKQLLRHDLKYAPFDFIGTEEKVEEEIIIHTADEDVHSRIGGYIDRLDSKGDTLRIVDYKTGGKADTPPNVASLFVPDKKRSNYIFQTFLYAAIMSRRQQLKVAPSLLYIHRAASDDYSSIVCLKEPRKPEQPVTDFSIYEQEFREYLQKLLEEIFDKTLPFEQTNVKEKCAYCDFKKICRKNA